MRELEHQDLFKPPKGTRAVVVPVAAEYWPKGQTMMTPMNSGYALIARTKWTQLPIVLGILHWQRGANPHPLTAEDDGKIRIPGKGKQVFAPPFHLISLPTRTYKENDVTVDYLCKQLRALAFLCDGRIPWLASGDVVLPQLDDGPDRPWSFFKRYAELYLPDERFVVVSGKVGTKT
jgi:hypothetical protein